jgi:predicted MFS family arabinose efflux permease
VLVWLLPVAARAPYSLAAALMLVGFADEWFSFFPAGALLPIREDLGLTYAQAGVVVASLMAGGIVGHAFRLAADFVDRRLLAATGALVYGLCMAAFAVADSFLVLVTAGLLWGAASDAFIAGLEVALVDLCRDDLTPALARVNAYSAVGDILGPLTLAAAFAFGVPWRWVFALGSVLMLLYAAWIATLTLPKPQPSPHASTPLVSVLTILRDRRIIVLALVDGLYGLLDEPFLGFTIAYLTDVRGQPPSVATLIATLTVTGGVVGFLGVELLTRRFAARALLLTLGVLVAAGVATMVYGQTAVMVGVAGLVLGACGAAFYTVVESTILGLRPGQAGATGAVVSTIGLFGVGFPLLVGAVSDRYGLTAGLTLYAAVPVLMLALLLGAPAAVPAPGQES